MCDEIRWMIWAVAGSVAARAATTAEYLESSKVRSADMRRHLECPPPAGFGIVVHGV